MVSDLTIAGKKDSLSITCSKGKISMEGNSILPNAISFFQPVNDWVNEYVKNPAAKTVVSLKFNYIDTSSVQAVFDILKKLTEIPDYENKVFVNWYFEFDDPELLEVGEIMEGRLKLNFNFIEYAD